MLNSARSSYIACAGELTPGSLWCRYMLLWIVLSALVILLNKYVLSLSGFPYPVALTCTHMLFSSVMAFAIVKLGWAEATPISVDTYLRCGEGENSKLLPV